MNGAIHGLKRKYVESKMDEIVSFAELEKFIDVPVRTYSAGMYMRLGFSVAAHLDPDILLLDEVFAVGDEAFQRKCMGKILDLKARGRTLLFVSHSAPAVERLCERAILLRDGHVLADGPARDSITEYQRLLAAEERPVERDAGLREWGTGEARHHRGPTRGRRGQRASAVPLRPGSGGPAQDQGRQADSGAQGDGRVPRRERLAAGGERDRGGRDSGGTARPA